MRKICRFTGVVLVGLIALGCDTAQDELVEAPIHRITGVSVHPVERRVEGPMTHFYYADTLTSRLYFDVITETEIVGVTYVEQPECDDTSDCWVPIEILNPTLPERRHIAFNAPIQYRGRTIAAQKNLMADEEIRTSFDGSWMDLRFAYQLSPQAIHSVFLKQDAFTIPKGSYEIVFSWETEDNEVFADTVHVFIDME